MNIELQLKPNPFTTQGAQALKSAEQEAKATAQTTPINQTQTSKPANGASFVQKIKETNDAVGFIQTGQAFLARLDKEGAASFEEAAEIAKNFSFAQKPIASKQSFDTTAGVIHIDLISEESGFGGDFASWKEGALESLKAKKAQISSPLAAFGAAKREQMDDAMQKINASNKNPKLDSIFGEINENLSKMRQIVG